MVEDFPVKVMQPCVYTNKNVKTARKVSTTLIVICDILRMTFVKSFINVKNRHVELFGIEKDF